MEVKNGCITTWYTSKKKIPEKKNKKINLNATQDIDKICPCICVYSICFYGFCGIKPKKKQSVKDESVKNVVSIQKSVIFFFIVP